MRPSSRSQRLGMAAMVAVLVLLSGFTSLLTPSAQSETPPDKPSGLSTEVGDTQVRLSWEDPTDSTIDKYQLWQIAESATLIGGTNDEFGNAAAVDSNTAVIGAPADDESGSVLVFARDLDSGVWSQAAKLKASDAGVGDNFGTSVALDGNTVVVGASLDTHGLLGRAGSVYVFTKPASGWADWDPTQDTETAKIVPAGFAAGDEFGHSVAVDDSTGTIVAGARQDDSNKGSAYVFTEPTGGWSGWGTLTDPAEANLTATLTASNAAVNDYFGHSVAVDGDTVLIGASGKDSGKGAVYVFTKPETDGGWTGNLDIDTGDATKLTASDGANDDFLGASVAIDDGTAVIGAIGDDANEDDGDDTNNLTNAGSAYVFIEGPSAWSQAAKLTASDREVDERDDSQFGISVAVSGDIVVIGADGVDQSATETNFGAAYVFTKPATGWADNTETAKLTASDRNTNHDFGSSVAIDGETVVVGAESNNTAYVFDIVDWEDIADSDAATTSYIVTGLTNDIDHTFRVRAVDGGEASNPSDSVAGTPKAASYAPVKLLNFSAAQTGDGEVEMTWDAHRYPLTVSGYEYNQDGGDWNAITGSDSSTHSHTVTGLTKGTTYTFAVRAVNGAGSTESDSRSVTIIGQPAAPDSFSAVAGDGQVWLGWRSPADFTISGYEYQQKTGGDFGDDWTSIPGSRSGTTFHIVTGLTNDTSYTFRVRAVNAAGGSDASVEKPATPREASSAPGKPEGFAARQTGVGQVELTWEASSNTLNVTGYEFRQNNGSWTTIPNSDSSPISHTITGLIEGNTYTFAVRAVNSFNESASSGAESVIVVAEPSAPTELAAAVGDTQVGLTWKDPSDASIAKYQIFESVIKLISSDHDDGDELGWSVAVDDDTLVIGALGDDPDNTGAAYVFTRAAGSWAQVGKLTAENRDEEAGDDAGFGYAVAVHGDTIVVGAYEEDYIDPDNSNNDLTDSGAAYVFTRPAAGWADMTQTARLTASDAAKDDEFGTSVAVHEDTIVVGTPEQGPYGDGSAYIFTKPANGWADMTETAALRGQPNGDRFGRSVAVHGDTVVVGAFEENGARGAAYVFTKSAATGVWDDWDDTSASNATPKLTASERASGDRFGRAVAMDGDTIVIGAPYHDYDDPDNNTNDVSNSGAAYVFIKTATGGWATDTETAKLTASERAENDQFGYSVAVDGNTVVVGADQDDSKRGSAYVFIKPATVWTDTAGTDKLVAYDRSGNDRFGNSVAVDGDTVLVGAVGDDSDKGSAYVFGTGEWADISGSGAGTDSHIARGLRNNVKHTFRVRAVNAAGESDPTDEQSATPVAATSVPSRPAAFTATQTGVGQVLLKWTASTEPLTVRHYQYKQNDGSGFGAWIGIEGSDSSTVSHAVTGLIAGIEYTFKVRGINAANDNGGDQGASGDQSVTLEAQAAAPTGFTADAGDEQVKLSWTDPGNATIDKYQHFQIDPSKLTATDGLLDDLFGYSVAVDGNTAVIGAYQDDDASNGDDSGSAYVFTKVSGVWSQAAKLTASDGAADDEFGYSVAVDGDTIVVGAHQNDPGESGNTISNAGAAYVFTKPTDGWDSDDDDIITETAKLTAFGAAANDEFGISVAVDGDTILVGAHQNDSNKGAAYIFTKFSGVWGNAPVSGNHRVETAKLIASDAAANDEFGISVAVHGDIAVIGAYHDDHTDDGNTIGNAGSAYVFTKVSGVWSQKAKLIASDGAADDKFGISVAVDHDTIVVGAYQDDDNGSQSGSAYVFKKPNSGWADSSETAKLTASDGAANDEFGISVAVDRDTVMVGAHQNDADTNNNDEGAAYLFTEPASGWADMTQKAKLTASDAATQDRYGYSVGVSGDTVVVGAYSDDRNEANTGAAYFLRIPGWTDILYSAATTTSHIVTSLSNDVEHTFQVRGVNAAGGGLASAGAGGTPTFAIPDRPTGFAVDADDTVVDLSWDDPEDSTIERYQLLQITQGGKLTTDSTDDPVVRGDGFGISVAVDGNTAVVGAYQDDDYDDNSGSVHVFTRSSSTAPWSWTAKLTADDAAANDEFGISVAVHGDTIVVGAHQNDADDQDNDEGAAYVFTKVSGIWGQKAKLTAFDATADDAFGISVAVHGNTIVIGAYQHDPDSKSDAGAVYVFTKPNGDWVATSTAAKLTASDGAASDAFGISVAVHDETVVVGAHLENANDDDVDTTDDVADSGAAYVFTKPESGGWADATETAKLIALDAAAIDAFGISVSVHGETVVVGAHQDDDATNGDNSGSAYVFDEPSGGWANATETAKLIASDGATDDQFGYSVAVDGDTIVVGSYLDDDNGKDSGSAYVFTQDSNGWSQKTKLTGPSRGRGDRLGYSVAVAGDTVLAGAYQSNISGPDSGAVYQWVVPQWADIANSDATTTSHTVAGLTNRVEYSFQVSAVDKVEGAGAGPPSDPLRATPLKPKPAEPTGLVVMAGDSQVKLSWGDHADASITNYQLWQHLHSQKLIGPSRDPDDDQYDEFGYAVAMDGDTAVVGMPGEDDPTNSGAAFVFTRDSSGTWSQVARLRASDPVDGDGDDNNDQHRFGLSVAVHEDTSNGDTIVVGAPDHSNSKGAVYVFSEPSDGWANDTDSDDVDDEFDHTTETAKFLADQHTNTDEFGISVAVDGNTIVVGAHLYDTTIGNNTFTDSGAVYVFTKGVDDDWANDENKDHTTETSKLSGSGSSDNFGRSVAIDGDTVVVGASGVDSDRGSAFVFNSDGDEVAKLTAYDGENNDRFGRSVAIDGKTIVVGAYGDDHGGNNDAGSAYVFFEPATGWANSPGTQTAQLTASDRSSNDRFGQSVAVDGETIVVGAYENEGGVAYVFTKPAAGWADSTEAARLTESDIDGGDRYGISVAVDGDTIMVGSNGEGEGVDKDDLPVEWGAAYLYDIQVWADIDRSTGETRSHFATGLTNGLEHTFAVRAVNDGGASGPSNQASADTARAASAPAKPRNFSAVQVGAGEVCLEWGPSADPLTIVRFDYTDDGTNWQRAVGSHSTTVSYTVSDLTVGSTYAFAVRAVNSAGDGNSSDLREVTIVAAPAAPTRLRAEPGDEQVWLDWKNPADFTISGYEYQQKEGDGDFGVWNEIPGSTRETTSYIVTGLTNNIEHAFRIRAVNVTIASAPSNTVTSAPAAARSRPARPKNFRAEQTGVGQVELKWNTAWDPLTVTGYQYTNDDGSSWSDITGSDSGTTSHTVSGLMVGTTYRFVVRAVNSGTLPGLSSVSHDVTIVGEPRAPSGFSATAGDTQATVQWGVTAVSTNRLIDKYQLLHLPQSRLTADDGSDDDEFGYSVAIDGNTAVVGAYHRNLDGNANVGVAYVFTKDSDDAWNQAATLTASDGATDDEFGISVAVDGDTILVGAHQNDSNKGAAYIFTKFSGVWGNAPVSGNHRVETAKLTASDGAAKDEFGISVAIGVDTVVVGAHQPSYQDENDMTVDLGPGAAYVFTKPDTDNGWEGWDSLNDEGKAALTAKLTASDGAADDELGISVAVDGDTVVAGAHLHDINDNGSSIPNAGAAYVFIKPDTGGWANEPSKDHRTESARLTAPDGAANDEFGISVAIDVDTVVVGVHKHDVNSTSDAGAAYVFTRDSNSGKWGEASKLTASNGDPGDGFGISVAVDGNTAVVGAYLDDRDNAAPDTGSTYVFARKFGVWSETLNLAGPYAGQSPRLGYSVAVSNDTVLAGVPQDDGSRGSAYAMDISTAEWANLVSKELTMSDDDEYYVYRMLNLTNDQEYAFRVRSVNAAANRPSAETVAATPMLAEPGRTEGLSAKAGNRRVTLSWNDPRDSSLTGYQVLRPPEQIKLTAGSDGETDGEFGESVAVDDGTAVVGAPEHDGTDSGGNAITDSGAAYVFTRNPNSGAWSDPIELTAGSDGAKNDWFGYSVAVDGDTIVIGAHQPRYQEGNEFVNVGPGAAYVFTRDPHSGAWSEPVKLIASDGAVNDWFGYSVAVDGDTVVVGANQDDDNGDLSGSAYVFTKPENDPWANDPNIEYRTQTAKLTAFDGAAGDRFGHSVAVHGTTIVVGAHLDDDNGGNSGAAYVFTKPESGGWADATESVKLTASDGDDNDQFGHSVAVDGDTVVVGARNNNAAYVFVFIPDSGPWSEAAKLAASDSDGSEEFGFSLAVRASTIVVGAYAAKIDVCDSDDCDDDPRSGAAYLFTKPANVDWANDPNKDYRTESGKLTLPTEEGTVEKYDEFGNSVALDGQSIVVGAPEGNDDFGSVYVSDIPQWAFLASGAETTSATVEGLTNGVEYAFQVRAVDFYGEGLPSNIARATPMEVSIDVSNVDEAGTVSVSLEQPEVGTAQRGPFFEGDVTFTVDENTPPGSLVGDAITATDPDGDVLTYSLSGIDASSFVLDGSTGQITVGSGTMLDYESGPTRYTVVVSVHDGRGAYGDDDSTIDDLIEVSIDVSNVDEAGTVSVSLGQPEVGIALVVSLSDPDGSLSDISWQWARSSDGSDWSDISGANLDSYTPVADDVGIYLQAVASYTDGHGPGKSAHAVMEQQTAQRGPSFEGDVTFTVDENTPPGSLVGDAITATDPDGDVLTYSLSGTDASSFVLDGSTGQITVGSGTMLDYESGPTRYTVVVSVHDGRDAYGNDDSTIDDRIEVSIDVSNVDEAGTVSVSSERPKVGAALAASLSDLDGSVSDISWQWAASSDGSNWSDISGANSDSYTPVADDVGIYLQATASYTDGHGPGKSAHAVMERQTAQRDPSFEGDVTLLTVDENTPPGTLVGDAITATDPDGDILTYSLSGTDASSFVIDGSTGQITVGSGTMVDYESGPARHTVIVSVHDGRDAYGNDDSTIDDRIEVSIDVSNVDEAGTVSVSPEQPESGTALTASLSDPDGSLSDISWQWAASSDRANWQDTAGASSSTYTPVDLDADKYLRVTASYADGEGSGKQAQAVLNNPVQGLPEPVATPTTTATDTPAPSPTPTPTAEPAPSEADGGDEGFPWWVIVAVVIGVVAGVVLIIVVLRSRR